jgi:ribosome-associated protein
MSGETHSLDGPDSGVRIDPRLVIPPQELEFRASRSSGPGGQSVNTTSSRIELRWDVAGSHALTDTQRALISERLASRLTDDGVLILHGSEHRSQHRNREAVIARFRAIVAEAVAPATPRRPTRPTRASMRRRMEAKQARSQTKGLRRPPED